MLDVGCGTANFLAAAERRGCWELTGIEPSAQAATLARAATSARIEECPLEKAQLPENHFDVVTLLGVLEHLHDPLATLRTVRRLLRPDGIVAIYVPNYHYLRLKDSGIACWLRRRRWSHLSPQEHLFHFTPPLLRQLLQRAGFGRIDVGVGPPFLPHQRIHRWLKQTAHAAVCALHHTTGVHLGGLEAIARSVESSPLTLDLL
jgi:SAM-dependent methyltransferase